MAAGAASTHDVWEQRYQLDGTLKHSVAVLKDICSGFTTQLLVNCDSKDSELQAKQPVPLQPNIPQLQLLRSGSPSLSARRNASLRNLAALNRPSTASSPRLQQTQTGPPSPVSDISKKTERRTSKGNALGIVVNSNNYAESDASSSSDTDQYESSKGYSARPIENTAQFLEWYNEMESQLAEGQDQEAHEFVEFLQTRSEKCAEMLGCVGGIEKLLNDIEQGYNHAREQTEGVKLASADLKTKRDELEAASKSISNQLDVYNSLDQITQLLHSPGDRVCLDPLFIPSLERTEVAIKFIEEHMSSQDSELYLMRFGQCRMRALTLIKIHARRIFKRLSERLSVEFGAKDADNAKRSSLLYVIFKHDAAELQPLLHELQVRAVDDTEKQVLTDVKNTYFNTRRGWLQIYIQDSFKRIAKEHNDSGMSTLPVVDSLRDWCAFVMSLCADEYRTYYDFFDPRLDIQNQSGEGGVAVAMCPELHTYLDNIMLVFHEQVRPLIIHESRVDILSGLSMTLLTYHKQSISYVQDTPENEMLTASRPQSSDSRLTLNIEENGLDAFNSVIDQILQDAQQRLTYKSQSYIRSSISGYRISKEDSVMITQWVSLCSRLHISDPQELDAIAQEASQTVDMQVSTEQLNYIPSVTPDSLSSNDIGTTVASIVVPDSTVNTTPIENSVLRRLLERIPEGLSEENAKSLRWTYPSVANYIWLVNQIDGCLDVEVQNDIIEEAHAACKQNLLSHGARFVREQAIKTPNSKGGHTTVAENDAEHLAHLFVTFNLSHLNYI